MPELRKDPVIGRWVIVAAERGKRPHDFTVTHTRTTTGYCPFCPGNESSTPPAVLTYPRNKKKPKTSEWTLRVVPNKYPALEQNGDLGKREVGLFDIMAGIGRHEIIIETPDHNQTPATLPHPRVVDIFAALQERMIVLRDAPNICYVLAFKNYGPEGGASLDHSHSQLIALPIVPKRVQEEITGSKKYHDHKKGCVFCDIITQESRDGSRIVVDNSSFLVIAPFASRFPFEMWILPRTHQSRFDLIPAEALDQLASVVSQVLRNMNAVLDNPPYNFIIHHAPFRDKESSAFYHWHIELFPKLTRIAGFEWGSGFYINPTPPEEAARFLRNGKRKV